MQNILIIHPANTEQLNIIKAFVKALKIKFEITEESSYNSEFVSKIKKSRQEFEEGKYTRVKKEDLQDFLGL